MNHPTNDELLLLAYGELPKRLPAQVEAHVATCPECRTQFAASSTRVSHSTRCCRGRRRAVVAWPLSRSRLPRCSPSADHEVRAFQE